MLFERALWLIAVGMLLSGAGFADEVISNGNFSGGLTGWTVFTTSNGTPGAGEPSVLPFTPPGGSQGNAVQFDVGQNVADGSGDPEGAGIEQTVTASAGLLTGSVGIAEQGGTFFNIFGGIAEVLLDSQVVAAYTFNSPNPGQVQSTVLSFQKIVTDGDHTLAVAFQRPATSDITTPYEYAYGFTASDDVVPEPSTWIPCSFGLAVVLAARGRTKFGRSARPRVL